MQLGNSLKIGVLVAICLIPLFIVPAFADPLTLFHTPFVDSFSVAAQETFPRGLAFSSDGTKMFVTGESGVVNEYTLTSGFDVSTASFVDSFSVFAQETSPRDLTFSSDGTKMFVVGAFSENVSEYTLTSPFDVSTASFANSFSVAAQETVSQDIAFSSDGTKMFVLGNTGDDVNEYTLTSGFDVSTASFVDSFSVAAQETFPAGLAFSSDGTKMFVLGNTGNDVNQYTLTSPFDVSTASFVDSFSVAAQDALPRGLAFSSDGTKMFVLGDAGDDVSEYTLAPQFTLFHTTFVDSFSVLAQDNFPTGVAFSSDGTKMFVVGADGDDVNEYTLTSPFDVSTASFVDSFSVLAQDGTPRNLAFSSDGLKMFVVGAIGDDINEYTLTSPFDVSTASFVDSFSVATQETGPTGIAFSSDGTKMFVVGFVGDDVNEYTLTSGFDVSTASFVDSFSVAAQDTNPRDVAFSSDGLTMFVVGDAGDAVYQYTLTSPFDVSTATFVDSFSIAGQDTGSTGFAFSSNGLKMFVVGEIGDDIIEYTLTAPFTLFHTTFVDSFSVAAQETLSTGVAFSSDGSKMFVVGTTGDDVNEYTLTSPFDVSTASFVDSFSVFTQETRPTGVAFSSDGTKMFVVGFDGDAVYEYTLTSGFDVSTASFVDSFSVVAQESALTGVTFSSDGTKMFVVGLTGVDVNQYTLTSPFDVSTSSFAGSFSVSAQETSPRGLSFSSDGTKMFVVGFVGDDVNEYTLTTGFDVSTASFANSFSVAAQDPNPVGLTFSSDGTKMFVLGGAGNDVNEYNINTPSCIVPSGDWTVIFSCILIEDITVTGNVLVKNGVVLTIPSGFTLDINFVTKNLTVQSGGGVLIKAGGTIT